VHAGVANPNTEEFGRSDPGLEALAQAVHALQAEVGDFRAEFRAASQRLEQLVVAGNAEVTAALGEVKAVLVTEAGVADADAATLTEGDPQGARAVAPRPPRRGRGAGLMRPEHPRTRTSSATASSTGLRTS